MTPRSRSSWLVWLGLGTAIVLSSACGPSASTSSPANAPPSSDPPTTVAPLTDQQAQAILQLGALRQTDLGDGWAEAPPGTFTALTVDTLGALAAEDACKQLAATIVKVKAIDKNQSPVFDMGARVAENSITTFPTVSDPDKLLSVLIRTDAGDCLDKAFETAFKSQAAAVVPPGYTITSVRTRKRTVKPVGDDRAAFEITVDVADAKGQIKTLVITRVAVEVGASILDFSFIGDSSAANVEDLMKPAIDRVSACESPVQKCA